MTATLTKTSRPVVFSAETSMAQPVRDWLNSQPRVSAVADEIDAGYGIADLVAGEGSIDALARRTKCVAAITNPHQLRLLLLASSDVSEHQVRAWAPVPWPSLRAQAVEPLLGAGLLLKTTMAGQTIYRAAVDVFDPFDGLLAVELKLRDWTRGVAQAARYRLFAERSYLALPAPQIRDAAVLGVRRNGIGLLAVHADSVDVIEEAPRQQPFHASKRRRATEMMLHALADERHPRAGSPRGRVISTL